MKTLILIAIAGLAAQLVDGGLGMGFGATSTTILILLAGLGPAQASAVVHTAELGTTLVSGFSHWRFGNVDWKVVFKLAVPGAIGAFAGATFLSHISTEAAVPVTAAILTAIGLNLVWRFSRGRVRRVYQEQSYHTGFLGGLGLFGGFVDASGGGGWGPVTTSTLLTLGRTEPRRVVGTVNTAEFLVTAAATLGFAIGMWSDLLDNLAAVLALLIGGSIAAPIAAWLVTHLDPAMLGGIVGTMLVLVNLPNVLGAFGVEGTVVRVLQAAVLVAGVALSVLGYRRAVRNRKREGAVVAEVSLDPTDRESERAEQEPGRKAEHSEQSEPAEHSEYAEGRVR
ncbi:sulfite exporter TauE/SafE family protein [Corynebacterium halotolerans]|uniref:Probable membrane transporter protein n=1 Tax=Corynebacterium halotolerans YIM 70093 = DSM 44683 TaxID=1121362 RepID=M1NVQ8_9CORY|nr:sulfite exporter TauE/SafE family protein [Corynebacterium halotolerans]AGF73552.1 permease [Corynebacterium halotolerans YIM 70093 = DSM 44683]